MSKFQTSINIRLIILAGMVIAFLIPLQMITSLIEERSLSRDTASEEMSEKWGKNQSITGPILQIPYNVRIPNPLAKNSKEKWDYVTDYAYFLPDELDYSAELTTELRKRSIYETPLYLAKIKANGKFSAISSEEFPSDTTYIYYEDAKVIFNISDVKGLGGEIKFVWNGKKKNLLPGTKSNVFFSGLHAPIHLNSDDYAFQIDFDLKGSENLNFAPIGKVTKTNISADWKDPSFSGNILPKDRSITEQGFTAIWETNYFGRNYPQSFTSLDSTTAELILNSGSGVNLIQPIDYYHKIQRATKYGILLLVTSFSLFFLMEIFGGVILHPIQYLLIGSAMIVFYILNLSLSEHIGFLSAYCLASLAVTGLIGYYATSVLQSSKKGMITGIYYLLLYLFIYIILSSEEHALLLGSFALFIVVACLMHFTRKIDWYQFGKKTMS